MPELSTVLTSYSAEDLLSAENLNRTDETVAEVFTLMFGLDIRSVDAPGSDLSSREPNDITAIVGFSGIMRGACHVQTSVAAARAIASAMLGGAPIDEHDDSINDALGELCNMLAGGWKNSIPMLSSACALSPPNVISGHNYKVYIRKPSVKLVRDYQFEGHALHLTLHCEDVQASPPVRNPAAA
jgi:chemotaxis protein CheX